MKVLVFLPQIYLLGGAERLAIELAEDLKHYPEVNVDVLSLASETFPGTEATKKRLLDNGISSVRFLGRAPQTGAQSLVSTIWKVREIIKAGNYDVVESTGLAPGTLAGLAVVGLQTQHIAGIHDIYLRSRHNGLSFRFWRWSCRVSQNTRFYAISQEAAEQWLAYTHLKADRMRVIYNGIHPSYFEAKADRMGVMRELHLDPGRRVLLFVGRLTLRKGLDTLIKAVKPLLRDGKVSLLLVGFPNNVPESAFGETEGFLENLKQELMCGTPENAVHWLGKRDDVPRLMASADLLVHPARHEGFGLVLAEALAVGLPVVTTNVGGIPEVLAGTDSILVPPDCPAALRDAICQALNRNENEIEIAKQRGMARAEFFRTRRRTAEILMYFKEVVDKKTIA